MRNRNKGKLIGIWTFVDGSVFGLSCLIRVGEKKSGGPPTMDVVTNGY